MSIIHVVSMSGGKDSTACALLALATHARSDIRFVFADTGNEHPLVYEYLTYLEQRLDIEIVRLKRDFTEWWWRRRDYVRDVWPEKLVTKYGATPDVAATIVARVLAVYEKGPTGNPYLDLCIIKGRFPSRRAQFCTEELKTIPLTEYAMALIDQGHQVFEALSLHRGEVSSVALASRCVSLLHNGLSPTERQGFTTGAKRILRDPSGKPYTLAELTMQLVSPLTRPHEDSRHAAREKAARSPDVQPVPARTRCP